MTSDVTMMLQSRIVCTDRLVTHPDGVSKAPDVDVHIGFTGAGGVGLTRQTTISHGHDITRDVTHRHGDVSHS